MGCACFSQNKFEQITTQSQFRFRMKSSFVFFYDNFFWYRAILCLINGRKESFSALLFSIMIFVFAACCWYVDFLIYLLLKRLMLFVKISSFVKIRTWFSEREKDFALLFSIDAHCRRTIFKWKTFVYLL